MSKKWVLCLLAVAACTGKSGDNVAANQANAVVNAVVNAVEQPIVGNAANASANSSGSSTGGGYTAHGTEPFWSLTIGAGQMAYTA